MKTKIMMQVLSAALIIQIASYQTSPMHRPTFTEAKLLPSSMVAPPADREKCAHTRAGDQKGRDCVLRIGLETQEAAITK
jgi:hypothetical protein